MNPFSLMFLGAGLLVVPILTVGPQPVSDLSTTASVDDNRYVGQRVCKNCHSKAEKGEVHEKWLATPHAKAFETLASDAAKKIAKEQGIEDAQKSDKCLECHVTAFGVNAKLIKKGFKAEDGVQCETCHGPGEEHFKIRFKASSGGEQPPIGADEIHSERDAASCKKCHNERSPTYKEFCFKEMMGKIEHLDPRKERSPEELKKMRETCTPDCPKCSKEKDKDG
jgi:hypothetical protein